MEQLTRDNLKPFQLRAAGELADMLGTYPNPPYKRWFNPETGDILPFLCRLRAITGSGKTPMLALTVATLTDAIVLWTTNRGAVIAQTLANLSEGGRYDSLLPENTQILELSSLSTADWSDIVTARSGLTIILSTVALFNREGDALKVHQDRNGTTHWAMLAGDGPEARRRPLYVVYDEAHGGTTAQFARLTELHPRAFVLASASDLPNDLAELLPGKEGDEKSEFLRRQTVTVPTPEVVEAGLLKTRLYFVDCNTTRQDALKEANDKWTDLSQKLKPFNEWPVMCCIVNSTPAGLEVWQTLTQDLQVDPRRVALHLANVSKHLPDANPNVPWTQMIDTHKAKKSPENLRGEEYTHIIWNLSLREGWDEPWAYVAYLDGSAKSATDISQKIGRFLRQPNAAPFDDGDLNSAYFYFNVPDEEFASVLRATQGELENQGYEVISISSTKARPKTSRESPIKHPVEIAKVAEWFGEDLNALDQILLDNVPLFAPEALRAPGKVSTRVLDLRLNAEDGTLQKEERRDDNAEISVWDYLMSRLGARDSRIARNNSTCFTPFVKSDPKLSQKMQFGSPAMETLNKNLTPILKQLNDEFRLEYEPDQVYEVKPFNLVSPDFLTDDLKKRDTYRVRRYKNALHTEYNYLNPFEVQVAEALDTLDMEWCRNPSKTGYGIPIPEIGQGTVNFYPDFLLWTKKTLWAIDPKGAHLATDAIREKLLGVSDIPDLPLPMRVALVIEGEYELGDNNRPVQRGKTGCTVIYKRNGKVIAKHFSSPAALVVELK